MCGICQTFRPAETDCPYGATDPSGAAATALAGPVLAPSEMVAMARYLTHGFWEDRFQGARAFVQDVITVDLTGLTAAGRALARDALDAWEAVADLHFVETRGSADITFDDDQPGAFADMVAAGGRILSSTVNVSLDWIATYGTAYGGYGFQTYLHEIGHALGLGHQGDYNGSASFRIDALFAGDSWQASVMSYFSQTENPNIDADRAFVVTPMPVDILAIRALYGPAGGDSLTAGDTVHGRGHTLGDSWLGRVYDAQAGGLRAALTIADAGGHDLLDLGFDATDQRIDLRAGRTSDVLGLRAGLQIGPGTVIEDAIAGRGDDHVTGNAAANTIRGGAGNDRIYGASGNDVLIGGAGADTLRSMSGHNRLEGGSGDDLLESGVGADLLRGGGGADRLRAGGGDDVLAGQWGDDVLDGQGGDDRLHGGAGRDMLAGGGGGDRLNGQGGDDRLAGQSGRDILRGNAGDDRLFGGAGDDVIEGGQGADLLWGGTGADVFRFAFAGHSPSDAPDIIADFAPGDRIDLRGTGIDGFEALDIARHAGDTVLRGDADGDGAADFALLLRGDHDLSGTDFIF